VEIGLHRRQLDPLAGHGRRRRAELGERHRAEALERVVEAGERARDPAGGGAHVEDLGCLRGELDPDRHELAHAHLGTEPEPGRGDEEVEQPALTAGRVHEHEPARAGTGQRRLTGEGHQTGGDRRVDSVAARAQRAFPCLGRQRMARGDDTSHPPRS
jgi:hypothetical protein